MDEKKVEVKNICQDERGESECLDDIMTFSAVMAAEVLEMTRGIMMLQGTPEFGRAVEVSNTMAAVAFLLGCISGRACEYCTPETKAEASRVLLRWREFVQAVMDAPIAVPPTGAPIQ